MKHRKNSKKARIITIILLLFLGGIGLTGCNTATRIHLIDKQDIVDMPKGIAYTPDRDGRFYSIMAEKEVMQVKVEKKTK